MIKTKVLHLYSERKLPTVPIIQSLISDSLNFSDTMLRTILHDIGFCWRRTTDDRHVEVERNDAKASRAAYIQAVQQHRVNGLRIVYVDETRVNACHTKLNVWLPELKHLGITGNQDMIRNLPKIPAGKGRRLIILHAGNGLIY